MIVVGVSGPDDACLQFARHHIYISSSMMRCTKTNYDPRSFMYHREWFRCHHEGWQLYKVAYVDEDGAKFVQLCGEGGATRTIR